MKLDRMTCDPCILFGLFLQLSSIEAYIFSGFLARVVLFFSEYYVGDKSLYMHTDDQLNQKLKLMVEAPRLTLSRPLT